MQFFGVFSFGPGYVIMRLGNYKGHLLFTKDVAQKQTNRQYAKKTGKLLYLV